MQIRVAFTEPNTYVGEVVDKRTRQILGATMAYDDHFAALTAATEMAATIREPKPANRFRLKNGDVSLYALGCGYIQRTDRDGIWTTLWLEHGHFHIRTHDFKTHTRIAWEVFPGNELGNARKEYRKQCRYVRQENTI